MKKFKEFLKEDAPANAMGAAGTSGLSSATNVGIAGYDPVFARMLRRKPMDFGGKKVFRVNSNAFHKLTRGPKKDRKRYKTYIGEDESTNEIRDYIRANRNAPVIIEDEATGAMVYLRYGK